MSPACRSSVRNGANPGRPPVVMPLTQIKRRYAVEWNDLAVTVEPEFDCWTVRVREDAGTLYVAHRGTQDAAKAAGIEFAMFRVGGASLSGSPEKLARTLAWKEQW